MQLTYPDFIAPFYHVVSDTPLPHIEPLYHTITPTRFREDLEFFSKEYRFVNAKELLEITEGKDPGGKIAFLSFDDGLAECSTIIAPILNEMGIPATFFINPGFINPGFVENTDIFYRYKTALIISLLKKPGSKIAGEIQSLLNSKSNRILDLNSQIMQLDFSNVDVLNKICRSLGLKYWETDLYMSKNQLKKLREDGHDLGAHGVLHKPFQRMDLEEMKADISESVEWVCNQFNMSLKLFAFPFYDFNLKREIYEVMYDQLQIDLGFGTSGLKTDAFRRNIQRLPMEVKGTSAANILKNAAIKFKVNRLLGRHKLKRR